MKRWIALLLICVLMLCPAACGEGSAATDGQIWFVARSDDGSLSLGQESFRGALQADALLTALLSGPASDSELFSPIPAGTEAMGWRQDGGTLVVDLSGEYNELTGLELTLADYCIALTLLQVNGVEAVRITVEGREQVDRGYRVFRRSDLVLSGAEEDPVERTVSLCFRRVGGNELGVELRVFRLTESQSATMAVLQALLAGPKEVGLTALLPPGVEAYSARVEAGICYADFSAALLEQIPATREEQTLVVRSIVESLCSLGYVRGVQLMVEGEPLVQYGFLDVSQPLS